ncbi:MAG: DTW domain-containing protein YfiP [Rhodoferax sp.]|jgi:DTW domain-containing protein YfiP
MAGKRLCCVRCQRPQSTCICAWITPTSHRVQVLLLQHPLEVGNVKGSVPLLYLSLAHSRLVTGEVFDPTQLQAWLTSLAYPILLYPEASSGQALGLPLPPAPDPARLIELSHLQLVVLDGTWRKSRKMLYLNPLLQQLPRLSLRDLAPSNYLIRKAQRPDQLSTLEATCAALAQLEGSEAPFAPLLAAFDGFVAQQLGYRPSLRQAR